MVACNIRIRYPINQTKLITTTTMLERRRQLIERQILINIYATSYGETKYEVILQWIWKFLNVWYNHMTHFM